MKKIMPNIPVFKQNFEPQKLLEEKTKKKSVSSSTLVELYNVPLAFLYDEYIDLLTKKTHLNI